MFCFDFMVHGGWDVGCLEAGMRRGKGGSIREQIKRRCAIWIGWEMPWLRAAEARFEDGVWMVEVVVDGGETEAEDSE